MEEEYLKKLGLNDIQISAVQEYHRNIIDSKSVKKKRSNQLMDNVEFISELLPTISSPQELYSAKHVVRGMYYSCDHGERVLDNLVTSIGPIPVAQGGKYEKNFLGQITFMDEEMNFISGINVQIAPYQFFIPSNGAKFMWLSHNSKEKNLSLKHISGPAVVRRFNDQYLSKCFHEQLKEKNLFNPEIRSSTFLSIPTPYDDKSEWEGHLNQATHPSCVSFPESWNGYKYWMSFTPYPYSRLKAENPCIIASNDGLHWEEPLKGINPLVEAPAQGYNSDAHLIYNESLDILEIWYRAVSGGNKYEELLRIISTDGQYWSLPESMVRTTPDSPNIMQFISPSLMYENRKYKMWIMRDWHIYYGESKDGKLWTEFSLILSDDNRPIHSWHPNVQKWKEMYYMINYDKVSPIEKGGELYYHVSSDGINWSIAYPITTFSGNEWDLDGKGVYRGCLLFMDEKIHLYYGMCSHSNRWTIGILAGKDIYHLRSIDRNVLVDSRN